MRGGTCGPSRHACIILRPRMSSVDPYEPVGTVMIESNVQTDPRTDCIHVPFIESIDQLSRFRHTGATTCCKSISALAFVACVWKLLFETSNNITYHVLRGDAMSQNEQIKHSDEGARIPLCCHKSSVMLYFHLHHCTEIINFRSDQCYFAVNHSII